MEFLLKILANGSIDDLAKICKKIGVDIVNNDGSYKTIDKVFNELTEIYSALKK